MADQHSLTQYAGSGDASQSAASATSGHKRGYQACMPCRQRKVKCDLGPVDDPHDPPCVRCRREAKDCTFAVTRRKRRTDGEGEETGEDESEIAAHLARRKSARTGHPFDERYSGSLHGRNSIDSGSLPPHSPLDSYHQSHSGSYGQHQRYTQSPTIPKVEPAQDQELTNETAAALLHNPINTPGDALHMLLEASGQSEDLENRDASRRRAPGGHISHTLEGTARSATAYLSVQHAVKASGSPANLDPAIVGYPNQMPTPSREVLSIWSRLRFVRAGWFTAREAMAYIEYYYKYLAPLTPIAPPDLRNVEANPGLLSEEPVLTVTLLTIASRYLRLTGPGSTTRSLMIHERLWQYLQGMVSRMFWGQEQFGGGFCKAGARRDKKVPEKGRLRTMGTIESLLLLSDFHPRSMHFPPNDDEEDILAQGEEGLRGLSSAENHAVPVSNESTIAGETEPAVRSNRMSWSLIGFAYVLAYEIGIFGTYTDGLVSVDGRVKRQGGPLTYHKRADRLERLLYIYITQACGRFGFPSMYPDHITNYNLASMRDDFRSVDSAMLEHQSADDLVQQYWVEFASINKQCNDSLFPSKDTTHRLIRTGEYVVRLKDILPILQKWSKRLDSSSVAKYPKILLSIEVHYFRLYMNGLGLQALLDQWTTKVGNNEQRTSPQSPESSVSSSFSKTRDQKGGYVREVIDASRTILRYVVDDLLPSDYLKHAPVRVYFRIVSAAMFLLKTFATGETRSEVDTSLLLMDQTITALRTSVVDDVHLCLRIADLLEALTSNLRQRFIPFTAQHIHSRPQSASSRAAHHSHQVSSPSQQQQATQWNVRYVRQDHQDTSGINNPGAAANPSNPDSNITVMPPPRSMYNSATNHTKPNDSAHQQQYPNLYSHQTFNPQPQNQFQSHLSTSPHATNTSFGYPTSEEDWLTLDLQPLLDGGPNGFSGFDGDDTWFGNAFGPETHNNLEVLGKLMNEGTWTQQGVQGQQGMGGGEGGMEF